MIINRLLNLLLLALVVATTLISTTPVSYANTSVKVIQLNPNFGKPIRLPENAATIAIGDPNIADVVTVEPNLLMITGQSNGSTSLTVIGISGEIHQYTLLVANDVTQLRTLIRSVGPNVKVESIKGKVLLKGTVETGAQLTRVLTIADRYMGGNDSTPRFRVISDQGGVLAGNLRETRTQRISRLTIPTNGSNGRTRNNGRAQILSPDGKANLAQNISRANVISVANGRVISMIKVLNQPKVEIQMRIVEVDRAKTDEFGIDWRLDGNNVTIGSFAGDVTNSLPSPNNNSAINSGTAQLMGFFQPGKYTLSTFVRALEEKGATTTLSEPLLTAISGEATQFLVGGAVPIPTQTQTSSFNNVATATNVQYINFGLGINVRPTVLENGKINIVLDQTMSELDYGSAIQILGTQVPGFKQKTVSTITESESGETWAVAGLLTEEDRKRLQSVPWVSKIPILGKIFQNNNDSVSRNEMIILVNARRVDSINSTTTSFTGRGNLDPHYQQQMKPLSNSELDSQLPSNSNNIKDQEHIEKNIRSIEIKRDTTGHAAPPLSRKVNPLDIPETKPLLRKYTRNSFATQKRHELNSDIQSNPRVTIIHLKDRVLSQPVTNVALLNSNKKVIKLELKPSLEVAATHNKKDVLQIKPQIKQVSQRHSTNTNSISTEMTANTRGVAIEIAVQANNTRKLVVHNFLIGNERNNFLKDINLIKHMQNSSKWRVASGSYIEAPNKEVIFVINPQYKKKVFSGALVTVDAPFNDNFLVAVNHSNS